MVKPQFVFTKIIPKKDVFKQTLVEFTFNQPDYERIESVNG